MKPRTMITIANATLKTAVLIWFALLSACTPGEEPMITRDVAGPTATAVVTTITTLPLDWPVAAVDEGQVDEARACDIEGEAEKRYPESVPDEALPESYDPESGCDWAVLAFALAARAEAPEEISEQAQLAWANTVSRNAAYAFTDPLFFGYLEMPDVIAAPPFVESGLQTAELHYEWGGLGERVEYEVEITVSDEMAQVSGTVDGGSFSDEVPEADFQALGEALTGMLPVAQSRSIIVCTDNYPEWNIVLTFNNGQTATLSNNRSNIYGLGGPWWLEIDGQLYFQYSATFVSSLGGLIDALDLPVGEPAAQYCSGLEESMIDYLFSQ